MSQLIYAEESAVVPLKPATASARPAIRVNQANVIYPAADQPVHALKDINLTIRQGSLSRSSAPPAVAKPHYCALLPISNPSPPAKCWLTI